MSSQTGFDSYYIDDYTDRMDCFTEEWNKLQVSFDGIYSGFLAGSAQIEKVRHFLDQFKQKDTLYLMDPVMGDHGKSIPSCDAAFLAGMRELALRADVITPNLTELCLLAGERYEELSSHQQEKNYPDRIREICERFLHKTDHAQSIVVTGILREKNETEYIGNLAVSKEHSSYVESVYTGKSFSGTGDLFASVLCGGLIRGWDMETAMQRAVRFLQASIEAAAEEQIPTEHGVIFEPYLSLLL